MVTESAPRSPNVPGQHLGYSLQVTECLRQLLLAPPGALVSVEVFEDVGITNVVEQMALQTKSALASNPISDHSVEFWKALSNWMDAIYSGLLPVSTSRFRIHVFSPKNGSIAEALAAANTPTAAKAALDMARTVLWGEPPDYPARSHVATGLRPYVENVLAPEHEIRAVGLVERFELTFGSGSSRADLELAVATKWAPEHAVADILDKALGWVKSQVDAAHEQKRPAAISSDAFNREIVSFIAKLQFSDLLHDFAKEIKPSTTEVVIEKLRTYVEQLQLINEEEEEVLHAINSVLRGSANRTIWGVKGLVHRDSFKELEDELKRFWKNTKKIQDLDHKNDEVISRGQRLYRECMMHRARLQGKVTPDDFVPASFHELADVLEVGWHPEFSKMLKKK